MISYGDAFQMAFLIGVAAGLGCLSPRLGFLLLLGFAIFALVRLAYAVPA